MVFYNLCYNKTKIDFGVKNMINQTDVTWNKEKIELICQELRQADQVLVGIGAGFPTAAGIEELPLDKQLTEEQYWPFWMSYIKQQRLNKEIPALYQQLAELLRDKNYFIIDSNPDGYLQYSGLDLSRIYKVQGDMARVQCSKNCKKQSWIGKQHFDQLQENNAYLPKCPHCGAPLIMNVYTGKGFCDTPYRDRNEDYFRFINGSAHYRLAVLELGVGYTMPELVRFPFEQIVMNHRQAKLIRINTQHPLCVEENRHKAICVGADIAQVLPDLLAEQQKGVL